MATLAATKVTPLGDGVLIRPKVREETTRGGIILPDTAKEKPQEGVVVAVGPGRRAENGDRLPIELQVEQTVLYAKYAGTEISIAGVDHILLKQSDILAVLSE
ncbi:MAG TPA: co-chaperone GroES [Chloroflexota bacterium]|nr:co-chaperone GroES [Chloroflexota bacterium]